MALEAEPGYRNLINSWAGLIVLSNILLIGGGVGGLLTVFDLMLSERQRTKVSVWMIGFWEKSDQFARVDFADWTASRLEDLLVIALFVFAASSVVFILVQVDKPEFGDPGPHALLGMIFSSITSTVSIFVSSAIREKETKDATNQLMIVAGMGLALLAVALYNFHTTCPGDFFTCRPTHLDLLLLLLGICAGLVAGICLLSLVPIVIFFCLGHLARGFEFVLRRIAESSKGPIVSFSILLGACAGILKVLGQ